MGNLMDHAQYELNKAGIFDADADYNGMLGHAVLELVKVFEEQHHSESSAAMTCYMFGKVAAREPLSPITTNPSEWRDVSEEMSRRLWQNKRNPSLLSEDGGVTWYDVDWPRRRVRWGRRVNESFFAWVQRIARRIFILGEQQKKEGGRR
ncbi:hypothetical protein GF348_10000 [candidate division KSB3 bacterium]|nr:hypothetical protein [candidate division KSB3 bacterium]